MTGNEQRITVIDDNQTIADTLVEFLNGKGFNCTGFYGIENINQLAETRPDLVISDLQMPHFTGYEILDQMKKSAVLSSVPKILITAMPVIADQVPDANKVLQKPLDLMALYDVVAGLLKEIT